MAIKEKSRESDDTGPELDSKNNSESALESGGNTFSRRVKGHSHASCLSLGITRNTRDKMCCDVLSSS